MDSSATMKTSAHGSCHRSRRSGDPCDGTVSLSHVPMPRRVRRSDIAAAGCPRHAPQPRLVQARIDEFLDDAADVNPSNGLAHARGALSHMGVDAIQATRHRRNIRNVAPARCRRGPHLQRTGFSSGVSDRRVDRRVVDRRKGRIPDIDADREATSRDRALGCGDRDRFGGRAGDPPRGLAPEILVTAIGRREHHLPAPRGLSGKDHRATAAIPLHGNDRVNGAGRAGGHRQDRGARPRPAKRRNRGKRRAAPTTAARSPRASRQSSSSGDSRPPP